MNIKDLAARVIADELDVYMTKKFDQHFRPDLPPEIAEALLKRLAAAGLTLVETGPAKAAARWIRANTPGDEHAIALAKHLERATA